MGLSQTLGVGLKHSLVSSAFAPFPSANYLGDCNVQPGWWNVGLDFLKSKDCWTIFAPYAFILNLKIFIPFSRFNTASSDYPSFSFQYQHLPSISILCKTVEAMTKTVSSDMNSTLYAKRLRQANVDAARQLHAVFITFTFNNYHT